VRKWTFLIASNNRQQMTQSGHLMRRRCSHLGVDRATVCVIGVARKLKMDTRLAIAFALFTISVITGCFASQTDIRPATEAPKRVEFKRFSFIPPVSKGWVLEKKRRNRVTYRKTVSPTNTVEATVKVTRFSSEDALPPDADLTLPAVANRAAQEVMWLAQAFLNKQRRRLLPRREPYSEGLTGQYEPPKVVGKNVVCVEFDEAMSRDYRAYGGQAFAFRVRAIICLRYELDWVLRGSYLQHRLKDEESLASFQEDAEAFIKSVRFDGELAPKTPYLED
jgi:hypothetical protein